MATALHSLGSKLSPVNGKVLSDALLRIRLFPAAIPIVSSSDAPQTARGRPRWQRQDEGRPDGFVRSATGRFAVPSSAGETTFTGSARPLLEDLQSGRQVCGPRAGKWHRARCLFDRCPSLLKKNPFGLSLSWFGLLIRGPPPGPRGMRRACVCVATPSCFGRQIRGRESDSGVDRRGTASFHSFNGPIERGKAFV